MNPNAVDPDRTNDGRIVLIEDDDSIRQVLRIQLEAAGYEIRVASEGRTGLEMIRENPPDIVFTDLMMHFMDVN
jgi:DNA-binding response OmpR family regulator